MTYIDPGSAWSVGDIADPGLQDWLRRKAKTHLFISQDRTELDDLIQDLNLHLLETLSHYPSSDKSWPHFCRSQVFRKIRQTQRPSKDPAPSPKPEQTAAEAPAPNRQRNKPERALQRPDPRLRLSRLLGSQTLEKVAKQTEIPVKTLAAPLARMKQAMQRRYPKIYGAPKQNKGYTGMVRWDPVSSLPQPKPPEPAPEGGIVVWLNPNQAKNKPRHPPIQPKAQKEPNQPPTQKVSQAKTPTEQPQRTQCPPKRAPVPKRTTKRKPPKRRQPKRRGPSPARLHRLERKRAKRRLARSRP